MTHLIDHGFLFRWMCSKWLLIIMRKLRFTIWKQWNWFSKSTKTWKLLDNLISTMISGTPTHFWNTKILWRDNLRKKLLHIQNEEGFTRIVYSSYQNSKFFLRYAQAKENAPSCGGETFYTESTGRIVSKGFPMDQYENNLDCKWTLWAPKGYGIRLEFDLIYLEDTGK